MAVRAALASRFKLSIGGASASFIDGFEGGHAFGEVVVEAAGPDNSRKKHLGVVGYEDILVRLGLPDSPAIRSWIKDAVDGLHPLRNGSIYTLGANGAVTEEMQFVNALITEVAFPKLDAASTAKAFLTIRIKPALTRLKPGGVLPPPAPVTKQRPWLSSNFRFSLGQLPAARVSKVEVLALRQNLRAAEIGSPCGQAVEPASVEYPNLAITLAAADATAWRTWFDDFVINGNNADDKELAGTLTWLTPDLRTELAKLTLTHVGIFRFAPERAEAGGAKLRRFVAELYCEKIAVTFAG